MSDLNELDDGWYWAKTFSGYLDAQPVYIFGDGRYLSNGHFQNISALNGVEMVKALVPTFDAGEFYPDWDLVEAAKESLREHMKIARNLQAQLTKATETIERLEGRIHEAKETYTGMDGFVAETAPEAYQQRILRQMYENLNQQGEE